MSAKEGLHNNYNVSLQFFYKHKLLNFYIEAPQCDTGLFFCFVYNALCL